MKTAYRLILALVLLAGAACQEQRVTGPELAPAEGAEAAKVKDDGDEDKKPKKKDGDDGTIGSGNQY